MTPNAGRLIEWLASSVETRANCLSDPNHSLTYAEIPSILERLDTSFGRHGVSRGHCVALECSQSLAGALGLLYLMSRDYSVVLLPELTGRVKEAGTSRFIPSFCSFVVTATEAEPESEAPPESYLRVAANDDFVEEPAVASFDTADLFLRTSGSTGAPKLARMSHRKWLNNAAACIDRWRLSARDRFAVPVPIFHSYGFGAAFLPGLLVGASMDMQSGVNILRYLEREKAFEPNVAFLTPQLCDMFVNVRRSARPYRMSVTAGDKIKPETVAAFETRFGPLLNLYGSAEMGAVSVASPHDPPDQRLGTAGYALGGIELFVKAEGMADGDGTGDGSALICRQNNGLAGYLILDDGVWRYDGRDDNAGFVTGDLARIRDDGYLEILGRLGLSAKRDGLVVIFADVETAMERLGGLARVVVFARGETRRGVRLIAACVPEPGGRAEPDQIRKKCFEALPHYAVPDEVMVLDSLPLLPSGKVNRRALAAT